MTSLNFENFDSICNVIFDQLCIMQKKYIAYRNENKILEMNSCERDIDDYISTLSDLELQKILSFFDSIDKDNEVFVLLLEKLQHPRKKILKNCTDVLSMVEPLVNFNVDDISADSIADLQEYISRLTIEEIGILEQDLFSFISKDNNSQSKNAAYVILSTIYTYLFSLLYLTQKEAYSCESEKLERGFNLEKELKFMILDLSDSQKEVILDFINESSFSSSEILSSLKFKIESKYSKKSRI